MTAEPGVRSRAGGRPRSIDIMGLELHGLSEAEVIGHALAGVSERRGGWICPVNLDVLRKTVGDPGIQALVRRADLVVGDGMPLLWASRVQGTPLEHRVAGSSLIRTLSAAAGRDGASVFLLGGDPGVADAAAVQLRRDTPRLRIAGTHCPPLGFERSSEAMQAIERALVDAHPDIVFVGLGFPKQERLILRLRRLLPAAWWVSCGISMSYVTGDVVRPPVWVQRAGLEWVCRLAQEPRRLARRYVLEGFPFLARLLAASARRRVAWSLAR
jgi:N-acetylglucosaminyldiphosphoundecaprenol N-acetyl-beta-D-mannosaminyltransferase